MELQGGKDTVLSVIVSTVVCKWENMILQHGNMTGVNHTCPEYEMKEMNSPVGNNRWEIIDELYVESIST